MSSDHAERARFGAAVRSWRQERGERIADVARRAGVSYTSLCHIEQGVVAPNVFAAARLAQALDVRLAELLAGVGADRVYGAGG